MRFPAFVLVAILILGLGGAAPAQDEQTAPPGSAPSGNVHLEKAKVKLALKHYDEALQELLLALQQEPKSAEICNFIGLAYLQNGQLDAARTYFKKASKLNSRYARPYNNLGAVYHVRKQYKNAIKAYKKAIELDPRFLLAYYNLANVYFAQKKYLQGIDTMHKLVQLDPNYLMKERASGLELGAASFDDEKRYFYYAKLYAQAGDADKVLYFLRKSFAAGFKDTKEILEDKDFAPYQQDPRFQALLSGKS
jgi:tetratricopeptide (TPR) repeat protein